MLGAFLAFAAACSEQVTPPVASEAVDGDGGPSVAQRAKALGLAPWHDDFPFEAALSPRVPGRWYDRTRRQALAQIVANLQGACTQDAWQFARMFFEHAPPEAVPLLEAAADEHYLDRGLASYLENLADAMTWMGDPELAPVLLRLADHPNTAVATRAVGALVTCGTPQTLMEAEKKLPRLTLRATCDWLRAVARKAPDQVVPVYLRYLDMPRLDKGTVKTILEEAAKLPPSLGVRIAERLTDPRATAPEFGLAASSILHNAGDRRGSARLREFLRDENPKLKALAVHAAAEKDIEVLLDDLLHLSVYEDAEVRLAVAHALTKHQGENIDDTLTTLGADLSPEVRRVALRALAERGKRYHLDQLVERVRTSSGTNLSTALQDISASGDPTALAAVWERFQTTSIDEQRGYLQQLAYSRSRAVFPWLREVFLGKEAVLTASGQTTMSNSALLMANIEGVMPDLLRLWQDVPRQDYRRRAHVLRAVANVAGFTESDEVRVQAKGLYAAVWSDDKEIPQMRLFALHQHRRYLSLEDAMAIKARLPEESEPMRWALNDFLFEFF